MKSVTSSFVLRIKRSNVSKSKGFTKLGTTCAITDEYHLDENVASMITKTSQELIQLKRQHHRVKNCSLFVILQLTCQELNIIETSDFVRKFYVGYITWFCLLLSCSGAVQSVGGVDCVFRWSTLSGKITWLKHWKSLKCCAISCWQDLASLKK